jgi:hypothetical protein
MVSRLAGRQPPGGRLQGKSAQFLVVEARHRYCELTDSSQRVTIRELRRPILTGHAASLSGKEPVVAILVENVFPAAITIELIDAVTDEMDVDTHLPAGAILHVHYLKDGRVHGVDVWESAEAFQTFAERTLQPAIGKVAAARGIDLSQAGEPETSITEVHRLVR